MGSSWKWIEMEFMGAGLREELTEGLGGGGM